MSRKEGAAAGAGPDAGRDSSLYPQGGSPSPDATECMATAAVYCTLPAFLGPFFLALRWALSSLALRLESSLLFTSAAAPLAPEGPAAAPPTPLLSRCTSWGRSRLHTARICGYPAMTCPK
ncbi:unnamed protein product [Ectocarpus sp. CCAP 1310/34]|nr:unnamed protein product [Ectocarpus sp. CCAP 1310/34]